MKILFIAKANKPDYMSDMVFHGGKTLFQNNFYETNKMHHMYNNFQNKQHLYGRGFTIYGKIENTLYSEFEQNILELIKNKFFDKIIYGSIWRCFDYFDIVSNIYKKEDIIFIDGEDEMDRINFNFVGKGKYFKREYSNKIDGVYPISFGIPEELVLDELKNKNKHISDIVPNFNYNYTFNDEKEYYNEYANSYYAYTQKKAGWDCLRHYEIMMNGCIPIFKDLENCPNNTLFNFPKKEIIAFSKEKIIDKDRNLFIINYTKNNLTTKNIIKYILQ